MSGDELIVFLASTALGPVAWVIWFYRLVGVEPMGRATSGAKVLAAVVAGCALLLAAVLSFASAPDVVNSPGYLLFYFLLGLAWLRAAEFGFVYAGLSIRDDVAERRNAAAVPALAGAFVGATCCYAGGNVGAGPGWLVVVFSAGLATAGLAIVWLAVDQITQASELVAVGRDLATGVRLGGLLAASGLILGRAVAGDWHSVDATLVDFGLIAWVVVPLAAAAVVLEFVLKPTVTQPAPPALTAGLLPAALYLLAAVTYVYLLGWPA
jgi:hypothetical protein